MRWGGSGGTRKKAFALLETGLACAQRGDAAAALRSWNEAQGLFEEIDDLFGASQAFDMSATVHANAGRPREAISSWRRALDMQRTLKDAHQEGLLLAKLAAVLCDVGQLHEAWENGELALPLLEQAHDDDALVSLLILLGKLASHRDDRAAGQRNLQKLLDLATRARHEAGQEAAFRGLGGLHFAERDFAGAGTMWASARDLLVRSGNAVGAAEMQVMVGRADAERGDLPSAVARWQDALGTFERADHYSNQVWVIDFLAGVAVAQRDLERALQLCQRMRELLEKLGHRQRVGELLLKIGDLVEAQGDVGRAINVGRQALKIFEQSRDAAAIAGALLSLGRLTCRHGDLAESLALADRALPLVDQRAIPTEMAAVRALMAEVSGRAGNAARALELWEEALARDPSFVNGVVSLKTMHDMLHVCLQRGDAAGALALWQYTVDSYARTMNPPQRSMVLTSLARLSGDMPPGGRDHAVLDQTIDLLKGVGEKQDIAILLGWRAHVAAFMGEGALAFSLLQRAAHLQLEAGDDANRAVTLMRMASLLGDSTPTAALPLFQQAFALFEKLGNEEGKSAAIAGMASVASGTAQG